MPAPSAAAPRTPIHCSHSMRGGGPASFGSCDGAGAAKSVATEAVLSTSAGLGAGSNAGRAGIGDGRLTGEKRGSCAGCHAGGMLAAAVAAAIEEAAAGGGSNSI